MWPSPRYTKRGEGVRSNGISFSLKNSVYTCCYNPLKLQTQLEDILKILPSMSEGQRISLLEMIYKACSKCIEESNKLADIESLYIKGDMGWEENREAKKEIGCFELENTLVIQDFRCFQVLMSRDFH